MTNPQVDGWIEDTVGAICDPIIVMPGGWADTLPDWIKPQIKMERLIENVVAVKEGRPITATDTEAAAYLYTASLTAPLSEDWTQIYLYVCGSAMKRHIGNKDGNPLPEDIRVDKLTEYQQHELDDLKRWIYEQRVKLRKTQRREGYQVQAEAKKEPAVVAVQQKFF